MTNVSLPRILVVDDEASNIELLADIFADCEVLFATDGERALEIAVHTVPDVILLDVMMPGIDGFEVCARLKADPITAAIAVIFVTGIGDMDAETRGLRLGAVDYVSKPINPPVVRMRVQNQVELKRARDTLSRLATTDGLTGIANRRHFDDVLLQEHVRLARDHGELSLLLIDIDHFKPYNDTYGHVMGDDTLRRVARAIESAAMRPADLVARYGGEEFGCIIPDTPEPGAREIARRLQDAVLALAIDHASSPTAPIITVSAGLASIQCRPGGSVLELLGLADEQLYLAKAGGRNRLSTAA